MISPSTEHFPSATQKGAHQGGLGLHLLPVFLPSRPGSQLLSPPLHVLCNILPSSHFTVPASDERRVKNSDRQKTTMCLEQGMSVSKDKALSLSRLRTIPPNLKHTPSKPTQAPVGAPALCNGERRRVRKPGPLQNPNAIRHASY